MYFIGVGAAMSAVVAGLSPEPDAPDAPFACEPAPLIAAAPGMFVWLVGPIAPAPAWAPTPAVSAFGGRAPLLVLPAPARLDCPDALGVLTLGVGLVCVVGELPAAG
jgi:hypothetical protein